MLSWKRNVSLLLLFACIRLFASLSIFWFLTEHVHFFPFALPYRVFAHFSVSLTLGTHLSDRAIHPYLSCMFPGYFCAFEFCHGDLGRRNFNISISANYFPLSLFPWISPIGSFHLSQVQIHVLLFFSVTMSSFPTFNSLIYLEIIVNFLLKRSTQKCLNKLEWGGHTHDLFHHTSIWMCSHRSVTRDTWMVPCMEHTQALYFHGYTLAFSTHVLYWH